MTILNGWKEIGDYLRRTPKSAQRWERLGLPAWRISKSKRSPVIAYAEEIDQWLRRNGLPEPGKRRERTRPTHGSAVVNPNMQELAEKLKLMRELRAQSGNLRSETRLAQENLYRTVGSLLSLIRPS